MRQFQWNLNMLEHFLSLFPSQFSTKMEIAMHIGSSLMPNGASWQNWGV